MFRILLIAGLISTVSAFETCLLPSRNDTSSHDPSSCKGVGYFFLALNIGLAVASFGLIIAVHLLIRRRDRAVLNASPAPEGELPCCSCGRKMDRSSTTLLSESRAAIAPYPNEGAMPQPPLCPVCTISPYTLYALSFLCVLLCLFSFIGYLTNVYLLCAMFGGFGVMLLVSGILGLRRNWRTMMETETSGHDSSSLRYISSQLPYDFPPLDKPILFHGEEVLFVQAPRPDRSALHVAVSSSRFFVLKSHWLLAYVCIFFFFINGIFLLAAKKNDGLEWLGPLCYIGFYIAFCPLYASLITHLNIKPGYILTNKRAICVKKWYGNTYVQYFPYAEMRDIQIIKSAAPFYTTIRFLRNGGPDFCFTELQNVTEVETVVNILRTRSAASHLTSHWRDNLIVPEATPTFKTVCYVLIALLPTIVLAVLGPLGISQHKNFNWYLGCLCMAIFAGGLMYYPLTFSRLASEVVENINGSVSDSDNNTVQA